MFHNIFTKQTEKIAPVVKEEQVVEEPQQVIDSTHIQKDIQATFDSVLAEFKLTASKETQIEQLESKLEDFKNENKQIYDKINKLKSLGFNNTPSMTKTLKELEQREKVIEEDKSKIQSQLDSINRMKGLIEQYKIKYPTFKFVDNDTMLSIMKKYDLWLGDTFMYSKEIPDRALDIISGFQKEIEGSKEEIRFYEELYRGSITNTTFNIIKVKEENIDDPTSLHYLSEMTLPQSFTTRTFRKDIRTKLKMIAPESHFEIPVADIYNKKTGETETHPLYKMDEVTRRITPTVKELNKVAKINKEVLDPIACLEVDGGFIILDAWDKEAEIPEIKNPLNN